MPLSYKTPLPKKVSQKIIKNVKGQLWVISTKKYEENEANLFYPLALQLEL